MSKKNLFKLPELGLEEHVNRIMTYNTVSTESISSMLNSVVDGTKSMFVNLVSINTERAYKEATSDKFAVYRALGEMDNLELGSISILIPDKMTGPMNAVISDLTFAYDSFTNDFLKLIDSIVSDLAVSVNTVSDPEGLFLPPNSVVTSRKIEAKRKTLHSNLSKHFGALNTKSLSPILNHYRSTKEIQETYQLLNVCEDTFRSVSMSKLLGKQEAISTNIDALVAKARGMGETLKSTSATRETTEVLRNLASGLEFVGYMQAIVFQIYASVEDMGERIIEFSKNK